MPPFARREFSGNAVPTTITGGIAAGDLTINIALATGWPTGATGPFIATLDQGLATEEKVEVASRAGLVLTITPTGRGHDNTAAVGHGATAKIEHTLAARDLAEANQHAADVTLDNHTQYFNAARHTATVHAINTADLVDGAVTYAKHAAGQRWEPGDHKWSMIAADHTGWLLEDGRAVSRTTYANLFALVGFAFGADPGGNNFLLPDMRKKGVLGKAAAGVGSVLGGSGGSADAVVVSHVHTVNHSHTGSTAGESGHWHSVNHGHTASSNNPGDHRHMDDLGVNYAWRHNSGDNDYFVPNTFNPRASGVTFTDHRLAGGHTHAITVDVNNFNSGAGSNHSHGVTVDVFNGNSGTVGQSATDANLPPFIALNGFIHV